MAILKFERSVHNAILDIKFPIAIKNIQGQSNWGAVIGAGPKIFVNCNGRLRSIFRKNKNGRPAGIKG